LSKILNRGSLCRNVIHAGNHWGMPYTIGL